MITSLSLSLARTIYICISIFIASDDDVQIPEFLMNVPDTRNN